MSQPVTTPKLPARCLRARCASPALKMQANGLLSCETCAIVWSACPRCGSFEVTFRFDGYVGYDCACGYKSGRRFVARKMIWEPEGLSFSFGTRLLCLECRDIFNVNDMAIYADDPGLCKGCAGREAGWTDEQVAAWKAKTIAFYRAHLNRHPITPDLFTGGYVPAIRVTTTESDPETGKPIRIVERNVALTDEALERFYYYPAVHWTKDASSLVSL